MNTLEEIMNSTEYFLNAVTVGHILRVSPQSLRECAKNHPELIGLPFSFIGTKMIIPRLPFINWVLGQ